MTTEHASASTTQPAAGGLTDRERYLGNALRLVLVAAGVIRDVPATGPEILAAAEHFIASKAASPSPPGLDEGGVEAAARVMAPKAFAKLEAHLSACRSYGGELAERAEDTFGAIMGRNECAAVMTTARAAITAYLEATHGR